MSIDSAVLRETATGLLSALPAEEIGAIYCDEGGAEFFRATAPRIVELGLEIAHAMLGRLETLPSTGSLYVGAGIAEVPMILAEVLGAGRRVVACNLRENECDLLREAFSRCDAVPDGAVEVYAEDAHDAISRLDGHCSHVSMISVWTDPETFPQISGLTYGRLAPVLLDVDGFERERSRIRATLDAVLGAVSRPAMVTTTGEEGPWIYDWVHRKDVGVEVDVDDVVLEAAVVGDPVGFLRLRAATGTGA